MKNVTTLTHRLPTVAVAAVSLAATLWLVTEVAQQSEPPTPAAAVQPSDGSFDRNEHRRHLAVIKDQADGFDVAEAARFDRLEEPLSEQVDPTGFDEAERSRHLRLAPK